MSFSLGLIKNLKIKKIITAIRNNKIVFVLSVLFLSFIPAVLTYLNFWKEFNQEPTSGILKICSGANKFILGASESIDVPEILVIDGEPIITTKIKNGKLYVNASIYDKEGEIVAKIEENKWKINKSNYFELEESDRELKVVNSYNKISLRVIVLDDCSVKVTGEFYAGSYKMIATDDHVTMEPINNQFN